MNIIKAVRENINHELVEIMATQVVLQQCQTQKSKGLYLIDRFGERPQLMNIFRTVYDPFRWWSFRPSKKTRRLVYVNPPNTWVGENDPDLKEVSLLGVLRRISISPWPEHENIYDSFISWLPPEYRPCFNWLVNRDFDCDLRAHTLDRVFGACGASLINHTQIKFTIEFFNKGDRFGSAILENPITFKNVGISVEGAATTLKWLAGLGVELCNIPEDIL